MRFEVAKITYAIMKGCDFMITFLQTFFVCLLFFGTIAGLIYTMIYGTYETMKWIKEDKDTNKQ